MQGVKHREIKLATCPPHLPRSPAVLCRWTTPLQFRHPRKGAENLQRFERHRLFNADGAVGALVATPLLLPSPLLLVVILSLLILRIVLFLLLIILLLLLLLLLLLRLLLLHVLLLGIVLKGVNVVRTERRT